MFAASASSLDPQRGIGFFASSKHYKLVSTKSREPIGPLISFSHHGLTRSLFLHVLIITSAVIRWLSPALLTPEQASNLSTHRMKSTLLAAPGQLNLESRAKQGHRKKSVQLHSRDDVWPSLFPQRDILVDISTGWRSLTFQARGAKQPIPEPSFESPPISQVDLQLVQMLQPKSSPATPAEPKKNTSSNPVEDSDEQGEDSSFSSSSDSSESSLEECATPTTSSLLVMNENW